MFESLAIKFTRFGAEDDADGIEALSELYGLKIVPSSKLGMWISDRNNYMYEGGVYGDPYPSIVTKRGVRNRPFHEGAQPVFFMGIFLPATQYEKLCAIFGKDLLEQEEGYQPAEFKDLLRDQSQKLDGKITRIRQIKKRENYDISGYFMPPDFLAAQGSDLLDDLLLTDDVAEVTLTEHQDNDVQPTRPAPTLPFMLLPGLIRV